MKLTAIIPLLCLSYLSVTRAADAWKLPPETQKYKSGPGMELAVAHCALCHSADYLSTQPPLSAQAWKATVEKMRLKYGAPISTNNVDALVKYLAANYGTATTTK